MSTKQSLPKTIFVMGYGAIGKAFTEIALKNFPKLNIVVCDSYDLDKKDDRFQYVKMGVKRDNISSVMKHVKSGDVMVDLSTNIDVLKMWGLCMENGVMYMNTAMEEWEDSSNPVSFPKDTTEMYNSSLGHRHDKAEKSKHWSPNKGTTSIFEHGMNPGLISHFAKKGVIDAANYFLSRSDWTDLNREKIAKYVKEKNFPKLAQELGLHTIHCSEVDNQWVPNPPKDLKTKFYNTWSCRGFLTEGMVPIQVARGSHEDEKSEELPRLRNGSLIMSWNPSCYYWGKNIY
jgi:homospermidine synthase